MTTLIETLQHITKQVQNVFNELNTLWLQRYVGPILQNRHKCGKNTLINHASRYYYTINEKSLGWTFDNVLSFNMKYKVPQIKSARKHDAQIPKPIRMEDLQHMLKNPHMDATHFYNECNLPYDACLFHLEDIGGHIIDQTEPTLTVEESAAMSTAQLRTLLTELDHMIGRFSEQYMDMYTHYLQLIKSLNNIDVKQRYSMIQLIRLLFNHRWNELLPRQQTHFKQVFGETWINQLTTNPLFVILVQSYTPELVFEIGYLFPLLKMLFMVFGYSRLTPSIVESTAIEPEFVTTRTRYAHQMEEVTYERLIHDELPHEIIPVDASIYAFIQLFGEMYPILSGLMGGTEEFPPEHIKVRCEDIPSSYADLMTLPQYLWRFNDYAYCQMLLAYEKTTRN